MSDINTISNTSDHPADGHGYVPNRHNKSKDVLEDDTATTLKHKDDEVLTSWNAASKLRQLSNSMSDLQDKLIGVPENDSRSRQFILNEIMQNQVAMENLCSVNESEYSPQDNLNTITTLLKEQSVMPNSSAVIKLLADS